MNAFKVLTEFRFDVASAVANSQTLQGEVGKISQAADNAHFALQRIGMGLVAQMGLGSGGALGALYKAVQASDKFYQSQLKISNIFQSNGLFTGADGFRKSMVASESALNRMALAAREFSLPATDLANLSTQIGAVLTVKKLDDSSLSKSIDISRQFLKSAPILGVDPSLATQQLVGAISGRAELGSTLVQRLIDETSAMQQFGGTGGLKKFNALDPAKRLDVLTKSLAQFSSNVQVTDAIANSLSGQMRRLNDNLTSMFSILRPIGDALSVGIRKVLEVVNKTLENQGAKVAQNFAKIIEGAVADPAEAYVNLQQLRKLQSDVSSAGTAVGVYALVQGLMHLAKAFPIVGAAMTWVRLMVIRLIGSFFSIIPFMTILAFTFKAFAFVLTKVLAPLALMTFFFSTFTRAIEKAKVMALEWWVNNLPKITELLGKIKDGFYMLMLPLRLSMEFLSDALAAPLAWIFQGDILIGILESLAYHMTEFGKAMVGLLAIVAGVTNSIIGLVFDLANMNFKAAIPNIKVNFMEGMTDFWNRYNPENMVMNKDERNVSNRVTNIDKIEIVNQFKEQMEPDRVAFTLKEILFKAAENPKQAVGRSLKANAIGN